MSTPRRSMTKFVLAWSKARTSFRSRAISAWREDSGAPITPPPWDLPARSRRAARGKGLGLRGLRYEGVKVLRADFRIRIVGGLTESDERQVEKRDRFAQLRQFCYGGGAFFHHRRLVLEAQRTATDELSRKTGGIIPWVFHRNGRPIKTLYVASAAACK